MLLDTTALETDKIDTAQSSPRTTWYMVFILTLSFTLAYVDRHVLSLLVNPIKISLGLSDTDIGMLQGVAFSIFFVAATLPLARLSDSRSRPAIIGWCVAAWSLMTMLCGATTSFWQMMSARIGVAIGEAGLPPASLTLMADTLDKKHLAIATSVFMLGPFLGGGLAFMAGGALYDASAHWLLPVLPGIGQLERWQMIFIIVGLVGLLPALLVGLTLREPRANRGGQRKAASTRRVFEFMLAQWRFCINYIVSVGFIVLLLNAHISWLPAAMIRAHGVDEARIGMLFGPLYLLAGAGGTLLAGYYVSRAKEDMLGRTLRSMHVGTALLFVPALLAPVVHSFALGMALIAISVFFTSAVVSMSTLPLQFSVPLAVRAQSIAVMGLLTTLMGTGLGPILTGVLSDHLIGRVEQPLSVALATLAAIVVPAILVLQRIVIRHHQRLRLDLLQSQ
jgi:MFS family permease